MFETMTNKAPSKGKISKKRSKVLLSPGKSMSKEDLQKREK